MVTMKGKREFADEWQDSIGQTIRPGDLIAVATISGRSPQMVIAEVKTINLTNAKGERYTKSVPSGEKEERRRENKKYVGPPLPEPPTRESSYSMRPARSKYDEYWEARRKLEADPANWRALEPTIWHIDKMVDEQTATVTAIPLLDGRGFHRSGSKETPPKAVSYMLIGNIVRLPDEAQSSVREAGSVKRRVEFPPRLT